MKPPLHSSLLVLALGLASGACSDRAPSTTFSVVDSAGVRIATNGLIADLEATWRLGRRPLLRIGWRDDEPTFENLTSGRFTTDGFVVVGDQLASAFWRISLDGEVVQEWGRRGDGPGEFRAVSVVLPDGDTTFVQTEDGLVSVFSSEGFSRSFRSAGGEDALRGVTATGQLLFSRWVAPRVVDPARRWVDGVVYGRPREGGPADTLLVYPLGLTWPGRQIYDPFTPRGSFVATRSQFVVWRSDIPEIRWHDFDGTLRQVVRWEHDPVQVTEGDWEAFIASYAALSSPEVNPAFATRHAEELRATASTELPIYHGDLRVDKDGNIWLGEFVAWYRDPDRFSVIGADGRWIGAVDMPARFRVLDISEQYILGVERDEWDVQSIAVYEIRKPR